MPATFKCVLSRSVLTLWNPMDCSLTGFSVHGIFQARILEGVAISYSRGSSRPRDWTHVSCISCIVRWILCHYHYLGSPTLRVFSLIYTLFDVKESESVSHSVLSDFATLWTVALQTSLSMEFSRQEYWSGLPFHSPGHLPNLRMKPGSLALLADSLLSEPPGKPILIQEKSIQKESSTYMVEFS